MSQVRVNFTFFEMVWVSHWCHDIPFLFFSFNFECVCTWRYRKRLFLKSSTCSQFYAYIHTSLLTHYLTLYFVSLSLIHCLIFFPCISRILYFVCNALKYFDCHSFSLLIPLIVLIIHSNYFKEKCNF